MKLALTTLLIAQVAVDCCDKKHHVEYEELEKSYARCEARTGIPIVETVEDEGGHVFRILKNCIFPCTDQIKVEKDR